MQMQYIPGLKLLKMLPAVIAVSLGLSACGSNPESTLADQITPSPVATSPAQPPSGENTSKPVLVWADEFDKDGLPDESIWGYDTGGTGWGNNELQYYSEKRLENARVEDGKLIIQAIKEPYMNCGYSSARLTTRENKPIQYGRIEVSAKLPFGYGTWPAIWMLPVSGKYGDWPKSGEIDIMEHVGFDQGNVHFTLHSGKYNWHKGNQITSTTMINDCADAYHVYAIEWKPTSIDFFVDDQKLFETKFDPEKDGYEGGNAWPFDQSFYLILNLAVGGNWGGQHGVDDTIFPQSMMVDYVRVYDLGNHLEGDVTPPSEATGIRLSPGSLGYTLSWRTSTDNFAISKYEIMVDGDYKATARTPYFNFPRMESGEKYTYTIVSIDMAGNKTSSQPVTLTAE